MNALTRFERMEDLFPDFFRRFLQTSAPGFEPMGEIRIDVDEEDKQYKVRAEMPGVQKDDIHVEIDGNRVSITAQVRKDREEKDQGDTGRVLMRETYRGSVARSFSLAHDIDDTKVEAKLEDGVLRLTLPKREGSRNRRVAIQ